MGVPLDMEVRKTNDKPHLSVIENLVMLSVYLHLKFIKIGTSYPQPHFLLEIRTTAFVVELWGKIRS
jgi:hypothetical protein